jgi:methylated-DNA-[protein]-cysteine S-methyltransferase
MSTQHRSPLASLPAVTSATDLGWMAVAWREDRVFAVTFGHADPEQALHGLKIPHGEALASLQRSIPRDTPEPWVTSLMDRLRSYASGQPESFRDVPLELSRMTSFQRRVISACRRITFGSTLSYRELAKRAGSPHAARAVGNIMARNCVPLIVPCHRVIAADGSLGGYSAPSGLRMKRHLLQMEGALATRPA